MLPHWDGTKLADIAVTSASLGERAAVYKLRCDRSKISRNLEKNRDKLFRRPAARPAADSAGLRARRSCVGDRCCSAVSAGVVSARPSLPPAAGAPAHGSQGFLPDGTEPTQHPHPAGRWPP